MFSHSYYTGLSVTLTTLPNEVNIHILTYLRAFDLSPLQQTCRFYNNPDRIHEIVTFFVERVYGSDFASGVTPTSPPFDAGSGDVSTKRHLNKKDRNGGDAKMKETSKKTVCTGSADTSAASPRYTLAHLRSIELTVVARLLSLPEPKTGFYVSKSWIKKTLLWLEAVNEPANVAASAKKLSKKQERLRTRRLSDVSPPWPNANSDILCNHRNLQCCSAKAARSRRKLMDKQAWKILRKLYPDSTQLESNGGDCLQCRLETETALKSEQGRLEEEKIQRKQPLSNPHVRRFYTRTKGVPTHCLVAPSSAAGSSTTCSPVARASSHHTLSSRSALSCPLTSGTYVIIPRAWCHQWRRYMKTGEGPMPTPPDSSAVLCDAHKLALLPPHLEAFLRGETPQLLTSVKSEHQLAASSSVPPASPVGVQPTLDIATINALMAAGVSQTELAAQRLAMMQLQEGRQQRQAGAAVTPQRCDPACNNDLLDRENHVVVELVTQDEWRALQETGCWAKQVSNYLVSVTVPPANSDGGHADVGPPFHFSTLPCRDCDPTGLRFTSCASIKNKFRSKRWEPKSVEQKRIPNMEY